MAECRRKAPNGDRADLLCKGEERRPQTHTRLCVVVSTCLSANQDRLAGESLVEAKSQLLSCMEGTRQVTGVVLALKVKG